MRLRRLASVLLPSLLAFSGLESSASATDSAPPAAGPGADPPVAAAPAPASSESTEREHVRVRIGFNFNGGAIVSPSTVGGGGFAFRIGVQANRLIGVYYQASPLVFAGFSVGEAGASAGAIGLFQNSLMASLTPIDLIEIAAGPSLDYAGLAVASASETEAGTGTASKLFFGLAGRLALHLGGRSAETGRRSSFTIGVDPHVIFAPGSAVVALTGGLGADWY